MKTTFRLAISVLNWFGKSLKDILNLKDRLPAQLLETALCIMSSPISSFSNISQKSTQMYYCVVSRCTGCRERKRTDTRYQGETYDVGLYVVEFFEGYHIIKHF